MSSNSAYPKELPKPVQSSGQSAGFLAPLELISNDKADLESLRSQAVKILGNPVQLLELTELVYQMLQADLELQQERQHSYRGWF